MQEKQAKQQTLDELSGYFGFVPTYQQLADAYLEFGRPGTELKQVTVESKLRAQKAPTASDQTIDWVNKEQPAIAA